MTDAVEWSPGQDTELVEAARRHPGWDFHRIYGGILAVPKGTPYANAFTMERLEEKLADLDDDPS